MKCFSWRGRANPFQRRGRIHPLGLWPAMVVGPASLVALFLLARPTPAGEVQVIPSRDYFPTVLHEIEAARSSISIYMFLFSLRTEASSKTLRLAEALVRARARGVAVEVVLDRNLYSGDEGTVEGKNIAAYSYLQQAGVPVYFEDPNTLTHAKAVVIDERVLITGSSNWSRAAFDQNNESNLLVRSTETARATLALLRAVPREELAGPGPGVSLPVDFLRDSARFGRMVTERDRAALDVYLFLVWRSGLQGARTVALDYALLADHMDKHYRSDRMFRNNMRTVLDRLRDRYQLLDYQTHYAKPSTVDLRPLAGTEIIKIPNTYWEFGWDRRLAFHGKAVYLMSLRESSASSLSPRWSRGRGGLAARYAVSPDFISSGVVELRRADLLEVEYGDLSEHMTGPREPSFYTPKLLYDPANLEKRLEELKVKHGSEKLARAQRAAALVYEDGDVAGIARLIELEDQYGLAKIRWALNKMETKSPSNPRRTLPYLIAMIQTPEED